MKVPLASLRDQYHGLRAEIDAAMLDVIESTCYIGGAAVKNLEDQIASDCGSKFGIGVASGTDALVLSLLACGVEAGDEVVTTPFTFGATTEAIALIGATPVYVDIDECTFNLDTSALERKISSKTRALLPVDLFGQMADRAVLQQISQKYNLKLINDSAQAIGAEQNGSPIAAVGDATTLSFYPTKNLGAYGDGGMILTSDEFIADRLRILHNHGQTSYGIHASVGYCSRLDSLQAAILTVKLPHLKSWNEKRRTNAALYNKLLTPVASIVENGLILPGCERGNYHVYHQYTIRSNKRDKLQSWLKENGVDTKIFYPLPAHLQVAYSYLGYKAGDFPGVELAANEVLSLPIHPELTTEQIGYVCQMITEFLS